MLYRKKLCQFTSHQHIPDIQITPREWKPDPEVTITHDDLYARSWACYYEKSIFDSDYINLVLPYPPEVTVPSEGVAGELSTTPRTIPESSSESFLQTDKSCDGKDTDHYMESDVDTSAEQPDPTAINPRSSNIIYVVIQIHIVMTITHIESAPLQSTERVRTLSGNPKNVLRN